MTSRTFGRSCVFTIIAALLLGQAARPALAQDAADENPFQRRIPVPDFPRDMQWLNTSGELRKQDLKGKLVILDFWTYCCINCIHILPHLKKLEQEYPDQLVVIGVHSAKFETEKDSKNIEEAILRYEIEHPVVNDAEHRIWNTFGIRSWPTVILIDPEGNAIWGTGGEITFDQVNPIVKTAVDYYRKQELLDETPIRFDLLSYRQKQTPLRFPGKVLADEAGERLFITDSNHNRIVVTSLDGQYLETIGSGAIGHKDGDYATAAFDHPQGVALHGDTLYVADTENHMLRKVDLKSKQVTTIAGTGVQRRALWQPNMPNPKEVPINSPWALWAHKENLYIAMAGPHQIWSMALDESSIGPFAGNGREDIIDGLLLPDQPYFQKEMDQLTGKFADPPGYSSFAQPSGLASDGEWLFVADSEGSSIRAVPFDRTKQVRTVVGTADQPRGRLFIFGDVDGKREDVLLQHALGVVYRDGKIYVADTYNNKIKVVDAKTGDTKTLAGTGEPGFADDPAQFDEPAGIALAGNTLYIADTNNHAIRTVDTSTGAVGTLKIAGLTAPTPPTQQRQPDFTRAAQVAVKPAKLKPQDGFVKFNVKLTLPDGWKINDLAPASYWILAEGDEGAVGRGFLGRKKLPQPAAEFEVALPVAAGKDQLKVAMNYYYCQESGQGLCKMGSVVWNVPLEVAADGDDKPLVLTHTTK